MMGTTSIDCQEDEEVVKFTLNIITTCPDNTGIRNIPFMRRR